MKSNLKKCKNNSGITLIALVITIIVLIILAGISINLLLGDNGIIKKAQQAGIASEKASDMEKIQLAATEALIEAKTGNGNLTNTFVSALDQSKVKNVVSNGSVAKIEYDDKNYTVDLKNGTISETEEPTYDQWDGVSKSSGLVGEGTKENPYLIRSAADLAYMAGQCDWVKTITGLNSDETANGCDVKAHQAHYKLVTDISLEGQNWLPIGRYSESSFADFYGVFDGNNHEIHKLTINRTDSSICALFASINRGGVIKNLFLTDVDILAKSDAAGIAAVSWGSDSTKDKTSVISNCYVSGRIRTNDNYNQYGSNDGVYAGGIIADTLWSLSVVDCTTDVELYSSNWIGGIVGNYRPYRSETSEIRNCTSNGTITGRYEVGGISAEAYGGKIINCTSNCNIIGKIGTGSNDDFCKFIGGITGYQGNGRTIMQNCHATGDITINGESGEVGGLLGFAVTINMDNCSSTGNITSNTDVNCVGGLIGELYYDSSNLSKCSHIGNVTFVNSGEAYYYGRKFGVIRTADQSTVSLEECQNTGESTATEDVGHYVIAEYSFNY